MRLKEEDCVTVRTKNRNNLLWNDQLGIGYLRSNGYDYGADYWEHYINIRQDEIGRALTEHRFWLLSTYVDPTLNCDVGIGSGQFVERANCKGFDINPSAIAWLKNYGSYGDPYVEKFNSLTLWDVLEHLDDPTELLASTNILLTSLPIFDGLGYCLKSKHFKPDEHIWYFTHDGVQRYLNSFGFEMVYFDDGETLIGRESIRSYCFRRK